MLKLSRVTLVCGARTERWQKAIAGHGALNWVYFGRNTERFYSLKLVLSAIGGPINSGELINVVGREIRSSFINFDEHLDLDNFDLVWQSSDMAERNTYTSDLFFRCCCYIAFGRILQELEGDLLIFVEDWFLGHQMERYACARGHQARIYTRHRIIDGLPRVAKGLLYRIYQSAKAIYCPFAFSYDFWSRKRAVSKFSQRRPKRTSNLETKLDVLLVTWALKETFPSAGRKEIDLYWGTFPKYLLEQGLSVGYLAMPATWVAEPREIFKNLTSSQDFVILIEECLDWKDVIGIVRRSFRTPWRLKSNFIIQGVDLSEFLEDEGRTEKTKTRRCRALQYYYVGRFLRKIRMEPKILAHLFENQPWEKALRLGVKHYSPRTMVVGYAHTPVAPFWLGYFPSRIDLKTDQVPDRIVILGSLWGEVFSQHGYSTDILITGPAFRYQYLQDLSAELNETIDIKERDVNNVLLALPIGYNDTFELAYKTSLALQDLHGMKVFVKFHPMMGDMRRRNGLLRDLLRCLELTCLPQNFEVTETPVKQLLSSTRLVIHNGTSVAFEAVVNGIPALLVQSDLWLDINILEFCNEVNFVARTPTEIRKKVIELLFMNESRFERWCLAAEKLRDKGFCPVSKEKMRCLIDLVSYDCNNSQQQNPKKDFLTSNSR